MRRSWSDGDLQHSRIHVEQPSASLAIENFEETNRPLSPEQLDLSDLDQRVPNVPTMPASPRRPGKRRKERGVTRRRRVRAQRREMIGGLAVTAIALTAGLLLMGSRCGRPPDDAPIE